MVRIGVLARRNRWHKSVPPFWGKMHTECPSQNKYDKHIVQWLPRPHPGLHQLLTAKTQNATSTASFGRDLTAELNATLRSSLSTRVHHTRANSDLRASSKLHCSSRQAHQPHEDEGSTLQVAGASPNGHSPNSNNFNSRFCSVEARQNLDLT